MPAPTHRQPAAVPNHSFNPRQDGVERGSLRDLHKHVKRPCNQVSNSKMDSESSESQDNSTDDQCVGCPCSPDCQCRIPVIKAILPRAKSQGSISHSSYKTSPVFPVAKIPHGEQQYVLDLSRAVSHLQVGWLDIPDVNTHRHAIIPGHKDCKLRYGFAPEAFYPSVCVGRAEIIRFGGILNDQSAPRALNDQYFAF